MASFNVVLQTQGNLVPDGEPSEFVSEYSGLVTCTNDETGAVTKVGRVRALRVHAGLACDARESLFDVCDSYSSELHFLHDLLYEANRYSFKERLVDLFDAMEPDLLVLDYVVLAPKWRGLRLGLLAVRRVVDLIGGGCGLAVSLVAPLRHESHQMLRVPPAWLPQHQTADAGRAATVRLRRYYRRMGFRRLGRTPYYALPLNQVVPNAVELLRPDSGSA